MPATTKSMIVLVPQRVRHVMQVRPFLSAGGDKSVNLLHYIHWQRGRLTTQSGLCSQA